MKRILLTTMLCLGTLLGIQAQRVWTDPSGEYQTQTVVHVTVSEETVDGYVQAIKGGVADTTNSQIGIFVGGELRAAVPLNGYDGTTTEERLVEDETGVENTVTTTLYVYALRAGGEAGTDNGKAITFKLFDSNPGFIYPLTLPTDVAPTWQGDVTLNDASEYYNLNYTRVSHIGLVYNDSDVETSGITLRVGEKCNIWDYMELQCTDANLDIVAQPENLKLTWDIDGTYSDNVSIDEEGTLTALAPYYSATSVDPASFNYEGVAQGGMSVEFIITVLPSYVPVTSIAVENLTLYKEQYAHDMTPNVVFNNGESTPTYTDFTLTSDNPDVLFSRGIYLTPEELGSATVTITSQDTEAETQVSSTFTVDVISALDSMTYPDENITYRIGYNEDFGGLVSSPTFNWKTNEEGKSVITRIDETYTVTSDNSNILSVTEIEGDAGPVYEYSVLSKGTTSLTFTSIYDPSKSVTVPVIIKQPVTSVRITEANGLVIPEDFSSAPVINVFTGQENSATAQVEPADADFETFEFKFVDADGIDIEGAETYVTMNEVSVVDNVATVTFTFNAVPDVSEYHLRAVVDNEYASSLVAVSVLQGVTGIESDLQDEYWLSSEEPTDLVAFTITPEDAANKNLNIVSSHPEVADITAGETDSVLHLYSAGVTTFTITSASNPDVVYEKTITVKQDVESVRITQVGGVTIETDTPTEPNVTIAVGQEVEIIAQAGPENASITNFTLSLVNQEYLPIDESFYEVVAGPIWVEGTTTCSFTFKFTQVPDNVTALYVYASAQGWSNKTHEVALTVTQGVTGITLADAAGAEFPAEQTIWYDNEGETTFTIVPTIQPTDATDKSITVAIEPEGFASYNANNEGGYEFTIMSKGTATITFTSDANVSVAKSVTVTAKKRVTELYMENPYPMYMNETYEGSLQITPADADIDYDYLTIEAVVYDIENADWEVLSIEPDFTAVADGAIPVTFTPLSICDNIVLEMSYNTEVQGGSDILTSQQEAAVLEKITMTPGWNWISLISGQAAVKNLANVLVEARSQSQLIYNDPQWGLFGLLQMFGNDQAYKVNIADGTIQSASLVVDEVSWDYSGQVDSKTFTQGWNWTSYPYEYSYPVGDIFAASSFANNDVILSKSGGLATINNGVWEGSLTELYPNEGYMVYHNGNAITVDLPSRYTLAQPTSTDIAQAPRRAPKLTTWNYDGSRFANTMAVIGKLSLPEQDAQECTIGAFVGDECRGEGIVVNGTAYITAAGESGEVVTFRLYNHTTGKYSDVNTQLPFADITGSLTQPVQLVVNDCIATSINTTDNAMQSIYTVGNILYLGNYNGVATIISLDGKSVASTTESSISIEALPAGVYIINIDSENGKIVKKIMK